MRRNGHSKKAVGGELGDITLQTLRYRDGTFEPQVFPKSQRRVPGFDEKTMALYCKGLTTRDIQGIVKELYGVDVSPALISEITRDLGLKRPRGGPGRSITYGRLSTSMGSSYT